MKFKRFTSMLLAVLMVFSLVPSTVFAETTTTGSTPPDHTFTGIITAYDSEMYTGISARSEQGQPLSVSVADDSELWLQLNTDVENLGIVPLAAQDTVQSYNCKVAADTDAETGMIHVTNIYLGGWISAQTADGQVANIFFTEAVDETPVVPEAPVVPEQPEHTFYGSVTAYADAGLSEMLATSEMTGTPLELAVEENAEVWLHVNVKGMSEPLAGQETARFYNCYVEEDSDAANGLLHVSQIYPGGWVAMQTESGLWANVCFVEATGEEGGETEVPETPTAGSFIIKAYPSMYDARQDTNCIASSTAGSNTLNVGELAVGSSVYARFEDAVTGELINVSGAATYWYGMEVSTYQDGIAQMTVQTTATPGAISGGVTLPEAYSNVVAYIDATLAASDFDGYVEIYPSSSEISEDQLIARVQSVVVDMNAVLSEVGIELKRFDSFYLRLTDADGNPITGADGSTYMLHSGMNIQVTEMTENGITLLFRETWNGTVTFNVNGGDIITVAGTPANRDPFNGEIHVYHNNEFTGDSYRVISGTVSEVNLTEDFPEAALGDTFYVEFVGVPYDSVKRVEQGLFTEQVLDGENNHLGFAVYLEQYAGRAAYFIVNDQLVTFRSDLPAPPFVGTVNVYADAGLNTLLDTIERDGTTDAPIDFGTVESTEARYITLTTADGEPYVFDQSNLLLGGNMMFSFLQDNTVLQLQFGNTYFTEQYIDFTLPTGNEAPNHYARLVFTASLPTGGEGEGESSEMPEATFAGTLGYYASVDNAFDAECEPIMSGTGLLDITFMRGGTVPVRFWDENGYLDLSGCSIVGSHLLSGNIVETENGDYLEVTGNTANKDCWIAIDLGEAGIAVVKVAVSVLPIAYTGTLELYENMGDSEPSHVSEEGSNWLRIDGSGLGSVYYLRMKNEDGTYLHFSDDMIMPNYWEEEAPSVEADDTWLKITCDTYTKYVSIYTEGYSNFYSDTNMSAGVIITNLHHSFTGTVTAYIDEAMQYPIASVDGTENPGSPLEVDVIANVPIYVAFSYENGATITGSDVSCTESYVEIKHNNVVGFNTRNYIELSDGSLIVVRSTIAEVLDAPAHTSWRTTTVNICNTDENGDISEHNQVASVYDAIAYVVVEDAGAPHSIFIEDVTIDDSVDVTSTVGPCGRENGYLWVNPQESGYVAITATDGETSVVWFEVAGSSGEDTTVPEHNYSGSVAVFRCETDEAGNILSEEQVYHNSGEQVNINVSAAKTLYRICLYDAEGNQITSWPNCSCKVGIGQFEEDEDGAVSLLIAPERSGYVAFNIQDTNEYAVVYFDMAGSGDSGDSDASEHTFSGSVEVYRCEVENDEVVNEELKLRSFGEMLVVPGVEAGVLYRIVLYDADGNQITDWPNCDCGVGPSEFDTDGSLYVVPEQSGNVVFNIQSTDENAVVRFDVEDAAAEHTFTGAIVVFGGREDSRPVVQAIDGMAVVPYTAVGEGYEIVLYNYNGDFDGQIRDVTVVANEVGEGQFNDSMSVVPDGMGGEYIVLEIESTGEVAVIRFENNGSGGSGDPDAPEHTFAGNVTVNICDTENDVIVKHNEIVTVTNHEVHIEVTDVGAPHSIFADGVIFDDSVSVASTTGPVVLGGDYLLVDPMESGYVAITTADGEVIVVYFYVWEDGVGSEPNYFNGGMLVYANEEDIGTTDFIGGGELSGPVYFGTRDYGETFYLFFGESMAEIEECFASNVSIANVALSFTADDVSACGTGLVETEVLTHADGIPYLKVTYTGTGAWIQVKLRNGNETFIAYDPANNYDFATNFDGTIEVATDENFTNIISDGRYQHQGLLSMYDAVSCFDTIYVRVKGADGSIIADAIPAENPGITNIDGSGVFAMTFMDTRYNWLLPIVIGSDADGNEIFGAIYFKEICEEEHFTGRIQVFDALTDTEPEDEVQYIGNEDDLSMDSDTPFDAYIKLVDAGGNVYDVDDLEFITIDFEVETDPATNMITLKAVHYGPGVIAIKTKNDGVVHLSGYIDAPQITKGVEFAWDENFTEIEPIAFNEEFNEWDVGIRRNGEVLFVRIHDVDENGDFLYDENGDPVYVNISERMRSSQNIWLADVINDGTVGVLVFDGDNPYAVRGKLLFMPEGGIQDSDDFMAQTQLTMCYQYEDTGSDGEDYSGWLEVYTDAACTNKVVDEREGDCLLFAGYDTTYYVRVINAETNEPYDLQQSISHQDSYGLNSVDFLADDPTVLVVNTSQGDGGLSLMLGDGWWFYASFNVTQPAAGTINVYAPDGTTLLATGTNGVVEVPDLTMYDDVYVEYLVNGTAVNLENASIATNGTEVDFTTPTKPRVIFCSQGTQRYAEFRFVNGGYTTRTSIYVMADVAGLENYEGTVTFYDANFEQIAVREPGRGYMNLTDTLGRKLESGEVFYIKAVNGETDQTNDCWIRESNGLLCTGRTENGYLGFEVTGTDSWFSLDVTVGDQMFRFGGDVFEPEFSGTVVLYRVGANELEEIARSTQNAEGVNVFELNAAPGEEFCIELLDENGDSMQPARYFNHYDETESEDGIFGWWGFSEGDTMLYFYRNSEETGTRWWYFSNTVVEINVSTTVEPFDGTAKVYRTEADAIADTNGNVVTGSVLTFSSLKQYEKRYVRFYDANGNVVSNVRFADNHIGHMEQNGTDYVVLGFTNLNSTTASMWVNGGKVSVVASVAMNDYFAGTLEFYADADADEPLLTIRRTGSDQMVYMSEYAELPCTVGDSVYLRIRNTAGDLVMPDVVNNYGLGWAQGTDGCTVLMDTVSGDARAAFFVGDTMFVLEADVQRPTFEGTIELYNTLEDAQNRTNMVQSAAGALHLTGVEYESTLYVRITNADGSAFTRSNGSSSSGIEYHCVDAASGIYSLFFHYKTSETVYTRLYTDDGKQVAITATLKTPNVGMQYALDPAGEWTDIAFDATRSGSVAFTAGQKLFFRWTLDGEALTEQSIYFSTHSDITDAVLRQGWENDYRTVTDQGYNGTNLRTTADVYVNEWSLNFNVYFTVTGNDTASDNVSSYKDAVIMRVVPGEPDQFIADGVVGTLYGDAVSNGFALSGGVLTFDATGKYDGIYNAWVGGKQYTALVFDNTLPGWLPEHNHNGTVHVFEVVWEEIWDEEQGGYVYEEKLYLVTENYYNEPIHFTAKPNTQYRVKLLDEQSTELQWQIGNNVYVYEFFECYDNGGQNVGYTDYYRDDGCYMTFETNGNGGSFWFRVDNDPEENIVVTFDVDSSYDNIDHTLTYEALMEHLSAWGELDGVHALRCTGSGELDMVESFGHDGRSMWLDRSSGKTAPVYIVRTENNELVSMEEDEVVIADYNEFFTLERITVTDPDTGAEYGVYKASVADGKVVEGARVSCTLIAGGSGSLELGLSSWTSNNFGLRYGIIRDLDADRAATVNNPNFSVTGQQNFQNVDIYVEQGLGLMDSDESLTFYLTKATGQDPTVVEYVLFDEVELSSLQVFVDGGPVEFDRVVTRTSDGKNCIGFAFKLGDINTCSTGKIRIAFNNTDSYGGDYRHVDGFTYCYRTRAVASDSDSLNSALDSSAAGDVIVVRPAESTTVTVTKPVEDVTIVGSVDPVGSVDAILPEVELQGGVSGDVGLSGVTIVGGINVVENSVASVKVTGSVFKGDEETVDLKSDTVGSFDISGSFFVNEDGSKRDPVIDVAEGSDVVYAPYYYYGEENKPVISADIEGSSKTEDGTLTVPVDTTAVETTTMDTDLFKEMAAAEESYTAVIPVTEKDAEGNTVVSTIWSFSSDDLNNADTVEKMDLAVSGTLSTEAQKLVQDEEKNTEFALTDIVRRVNFTHEGDLPGTAEVLVRKTDNVTPAELLLYYIDLATGALELMDTTVTIKTVDGVAYYAFSISHCSEYVIVNNTSVVDINGTSFESIDAALLAAQSGDTVTLLANVATTERVPVVNAGVTVDLNGFTLDISSAMAFMSFGDIVDGTVGGAGLLKVDPDATRVILNESNAFMPLYDAEVDGYRVFKYSLVCRGAKAYTNAKNGVKFGFSMYFDNKEGYALLAESATNGVKLVMQLDWSRKPEAKQVTYTISNSLVANYGNALYKNPQSGSAMTVTVTGLTTLVTGEQIQATLTAVSNAGVTVAAETETYIIP